MFVRLYKVTFNALREGFKKRLKTSNSGWVGSISNKNKVSWLKYLRSFLGEATFPQCAYFAFFSFFESLPNMKNNEDARNFKNTK